MTVWRVSDLAVVLLEAAGWAVGLEPVWLRHKREERA